MGSSLLSVIQAIIIFTLDAFVVVLVCLCGSRLNALGMSDVFAAAVKAVYIYHIIDRRGAIFVAVCEIEATV